jgi:hypothetical protein
MSERQHIYEDLNESSSARPGGSQQLEVLSNTIHFSIQWLFAASATYNRVARAVLTPCGLVELETDELSV